MTFTVASQFMECFDFCSGLSYSTGSGRWTSPSQPWNNGSGRRSTGGTVHYLNVLYKTFDNAQDIAINCAIIAGAAFSAKTVWAIYDGATIQVDLQVDTSGHLIVTRNGTVLGTSTNTMSTSTWYAIEMLVHIADGTSGWVDVNVGGVNWLRITGADTQASANAYANKFGFGNTGANISVEDFYLRCGSGLATTDTLIDVGVTALRPTSDSTGANWTQSTGATHYGVVDDTTPNMADYDGSTVIAASQALGFSDLSTAYTILAADFSVWCDKDDVGAHTLSLFCVSNGATAYSGTFTVSDSAQYFCHQFLVNPDGSVAWSGSALNAATFGYRLDS